MINYNSQCNLLPGIRYTVYNIYSTYSNTKNTRTYHIVLLLCVPTCLNPHSDFFQIKDVMSLFYYNITYIKLKYYIKFVFTEYIIILNNNVLKTKIWITLLSHYARAIVIVVVYHIPTRVIHAVWRSCVPAAESRIFSCNKQY